MASIILCATRGVEMSPELGCHAVKLYQQNMNSKMAQRLILEEINHI